MDIISTKQEIYSISPIIAHLILHNKESPAG